MSPPAPDHFTHLVDEWCKPLRDFLETSRAPVDVVGFLHDLVGELDSPLAKYIRGLGELENDLPTEDLPGATEPPNLLPIRLTSVEEFFKKGDQKISCWVIATVEVLNFQATMGKMRTAAQELMLTRLERAVKCFVDKRWAHLLVEREPFRAGACPL